MPQRNRFTLLTVRGIPIGVDWSWFFVLFLIIWLLSGYYRDLLGSEQDSTGPYLLAVISALGFFASILLHELGHAFVALRNGIGISQITLWMFGGVAALDRDPDSAGAEFRIAAAGPAVTFAITVVCLAVGAAIDGGSFLEGATFDSAAQISAGVAVLAWLGNINAIILVFNLIPAFPLDGGRILRALVWKVTKNRERSNLIAARVGQGFSFVFIAIGIVLALTGALIAGVWLALIGWMLGSSARATAARSALTSRLGDTRVADVMDADPVAIPADTTIERALDEYFLRYRWPWFPVVDSQHRFLGVINRGAADSVEEAGRAALTVADTLETANAASQQIPIDSSLEALVSNVELRRLGALPAVDPEGRLAGMVTLEQVGRALRQAAQ